MVSNYLLSICIPTYNRGAILDETLGKLLLNLEFDSNLVEILVSDNCSTDDTKEIVEKYPLVKYFRNDENIRDKNFAKVLSYATGRYIKLFNDTLSFKEGALRKILNTIVCCKDRNVNLFFYNNVFKNIDNTKTILGKKEFLKEVSYFSTWIGNFGCWREDFEKIADKNRYSDLQFAQVDWFYRIVDNGRETIIHFSNTVDVITPKSKGDYNVFNTFINNYLWIVDKQRVGIFAYEIEKYRLLRYFVNSWLVKIFISEKRNYSFQTNNVWRIIIKKYWYEPYLYPMLCVFAIMKIWHRS